MKNKTVFEVTGLTKKYKKHTAVNNLSFSGYNGEIIGFLGPNGAGKTTTIKMMTGLVQITDGSVNICGSDIQKSYEKAASHTGAVIENPGLYQNISGQRNLSLFAMVKKTPVNMLEEVKLLTGLGDRLKDKVRTYSLGMKQRLGIGIALLGSPQLLILDEPTNGLDPIAIRDLRLFLKKLAHEKNVCVLVSSHMLLEMEKLCDRVVIINDGNMIGETSVENLRDSNTDLEDYYVSCVESIKNSEGEDNVSADKI
ncbi:MAG: ABC transporter ATP-binding protein [Oscillospiraceae bacterium]|nr:ABC transporter ATP-binding protein [Oscillospiraceae bacterium]